MLKDLMKKCLILLLALAVVFTPALNGASAKSVSAAARLKQMKNESAMAFKHMKNLKAGKDYVANEVLVQAKSREEAQKIALSCNAELESFSKYGVAVLKLKKGDSAVSAIQNNLQSIEQEFVVYPNYIYKTNDTVKYVPGDPYYADQYAHVNINNAAAWDVTKGSAGVVVAVIDTGIDINHPEFAGRISPKSCNLNYYENDEEVLKVGIEYADDDVGHGTHVAGIIGAAQDNGQGGCGVAPGVTIMAVKANETVTGYFTGDSLVAAINYAVMNGADIINMSLGRSFYDGGYTLEQNAIKNAVNNGVLVVCAAGNNSDDHADFPAAYEECVAVTALKENNTFDNTYSNYGPEVDISAPGTGILSCIPYFRVEEPVDSEDPADWYGYLSGTSMAAPQVSGAAALLLSKEPGLSVGALKQKLFTYAIDKGKTGIDNYYGHGALNTANALLAEHYMVSFQTQGGTAIPAIWSAPNNTILPPEQPKKDWYVFGGWFKDSGCTDDWNFNTDRVLANTSLFAKWNLSAPVKVSSIKASSASYNSINVSWSAVAGASGYQVYRASPGSSKYRLRKTVSSTSFKDTNLSPGKTYRYKVLAYKTIGAYKSYSGYSAIVSIKPVPSAPSKAKAAKYSSTGIKLTWSRVSGASRYKIYRATSKNGKYTYIGSTSSLKYVNRHLKRHKTYYYKVRSYRSTGSVNGKYSAVVSAKT